MRAPGCVTWKGFLSLAGRRGGRAGGTEHPGSGRGREARAALPQPGLGLPGSPCPKPLPPRQPRSSAVSLTVGHRVQGIAPTLPLSFHPGERGAYNPQPPSSPPTSTPHPAWSPQNAACLNTPSSEASHLPRPSTAGPGPAPRSSPRPLPTLPSFLVHQQAHCAGVGRHCLLHEAIPVFSPPHPLQPLGCSPLQCRPWVMCAIVGLPESGPNVRPAP